MLDARLVNTFSEITHTLCEQDESTIVEELIQARNIDLGFGMHNAIYKLADMYGPLQVYPADRSKWSAVSEMEIIKRLNRSIKAFCSKSAPFLAAAKNPLHRETAITQPDLGDVNAEDENVYDGMKLLTGYIALNNM